ncbi:hypothetical protein J8281_12375 [Aquimarina sp. U1-2]|uniref:hypothetical protein n=1 Tax=Aquimarina sp. U1-2 TaxID=2823141 RepID=UPI001AEC97FF|nr:hypothetical protein [Aquimarina sp. U1-2]MBP2832984.1 hypothetical protein [Aquimarina sp. U1-2]
MKIVQISISILIATLLLFNISCETPSHENPQSKTTFKNALTYNIRFGSEHYVPSDDPGGIQGFYAINIETRDIYYSDRIGQYSYDNKILNIPEGTYEFGAFEGYFEGASSEIIALRQDLIGNDGFVQVDLRFWSE